ncbi:MAG: hypothetical protein ACI4TK_08400 [Agathobacter sp.]
MEINRQIREKLEEIDPLVFYGMAGNLREDVLWNYMVFYREQRKTSTNKTGKSITFHVVIVRENEVPDGLDDQVIEKITQIPGVRTSGDGQYVYIRKRNTDSAVEALDIPFVKAMKG